MNIAAPSLSPVHDSGALAPVAGHLIGEVVLLGVEDLVAVRFEQAFDAVFEHDVAHHLQTGAGDVEVFTARKGTRRAGTVAL